MLRAALVLAVVSVAALVWRSPPRNGPRYTAAGELLLPAGVERWVAVGSSLGLGYSDAARGHEMFHTVLLEPTAYTLYQRSGRFPEGTMFALVVRHVAPRVAPARSGWAAGTLAAVELAVKDSSRFPGRWAYFDFGLGKAAGSAPPLPRSRCQTCHAEHAALDNVFVQFYPVLREQEDRGGRASAGGTGPPAGGRER